LIRELKDARLKAGMSQQQVANRLEVPQSFVAKIELGERRIDVVEFLKFVDVVDGSWKEILKRVNIEKD
jgi:transcriptional regulator with XRE-family HTH domain